MVEHVPNEEAISRLIYYPRMYEAYEGLIWQVVFEFPKSTCESVVWRRYAPGVEDVHTIGKDIEEQKKLRRPDVRYVGFISAHVGDVRSIRTANGHSFTVMHEPSEGRHHAHVCYNSACERDLTKNDKNELKMMLRKTFDDEVTTK
jgi:hypothetical protein